MVTVLVFMAKIWLCSVKRHRVPGGLDGCLQSPGRCFRVSVKGIQLTLWVAEEIWWQRYVEGHLRLL